MEQAASQNRINEGTKLKGDIVSSGFFRIDGRIEGNITNPSKIVLGKTGVIVGKMICQDADIEGRFEGNLEVAGTLSLKSSAHIQGDVIVGKLAVEPGATFNATCKMLDGKAPKASVTDTNQVASDNRQEKSHPFDRSKRIQKTKAEQ
ncbi:bactofilin family protein [Aureitalea marina]|nr:polymer-forming cytoskeletal protein [Aureitalea marina]